MSERFVILGIILIGIAIAAGVMLAPGEIKSEDLYADATSHIDEMDNITIDYYRGWMDALEYYHDLIENNSTTR